MHTRSRSIVVAARRSNERGEARELACKCPASTSLRAACSALQNANCTVCKTEPFGHHGNDVSH
jgi:hypothetical protein